MKTVSNLTKFMAHNPTVILRIGSYTLYEHPTRGDTAPLYLATPCGRLINTGFYDTGDFDLSLCEELAVNAIRNGNIGKRQCLT